MRNRSGTVFSADLFLITPHISDWPANAGIIFFTVLGIVFNLSFFQKLMIKRNVWICACINVLQVNHSTKFPTWQNFVLLVCTYKLFSYYMYAIRVWNIIRESSITFYEMQEKWMLWDPGISYNLRSNWQY